MEAEGALCGHPPQPTLHPSDLRQEGPVLTPSSLPPRPLYFPDKLHDHDHEVRIQRPRLLTTDLLNVPPPGFRTRTTFQPPKANPSFTSFLLGSHFLGAATLAALSGMPSFLRTPSLSMQHPHPPLPPPHSQRRDFWARFSDPAPIHPRPHTPPPRIFSLQPPLPDHTTGTNIHLPRAAFPSGTCFKWMCSNSIPFP